MFRMIAPALLLCLPLLTGCICPYCAPKLDYTQRVQLGDSAAEVHAFRVDSHTTICDWGRDVTERLTEIPLARADVVPSQLETSLTSGLVVFGPVCFTTGTRHSMALRLYRPGYELVEIPSWEWTDQIVWKVANDLEAQEKALDALVPPCDITTFKEQMSLHIRMPWARSFSAPLPDSGSASPEHRAALLFGSSEYERLAAADPSSYQRVRLLNKAEALRKRANE